MPEKVDKYKTWQWLFKNDLKFIAEALLYTAQEQGIRTNYVEHHIGKASEGPVYIMWKKKGESVQHLVSGCEKLVQKEYNREHNNAVKKVHQDLCKNNGLKHTGKWYEQIPEGTIENEEQKVLRNINVQCDSLTEGRRPDITLTDTRE